MLFDVGRVGRQTATKTRALTDAGVYTSETLDLNFMSTLDPRITFTRAAGPATYFDGGVLQSAGTNVPRFDNDPVTLAPRGLLVEEARTNSIRNSTMVGAVAGTPGTLPTNWGLNAGTTGLSSQVVSIGSENGIAYMDFRIFGTAAAASSYQLTLEGTTNIAAVTGQLWAYSHYWSLASGSLNGIPSIQADIRELTAAGAFIRDNLVAFTLPVSGALVPQRPSTVVTLSGGGTVGMVQPRWVINVNNGAAIDLTLRIGIPQLELGAFVTSVIPTTAAAATRAADNTTMPTGTWFNTTTGTLVTDFAESPIPATQNTEQTGIGTSSGDLIRILVGLGGTQITVQAFTASTNRGSAVTANSLVANAATKAGFTYNSGTLALTLTLNGGAVASAVATALPAFSTLYIGGSGRGLALNGYIRRVRYWPRVLSDAELRAVTT